jgi:hypothetical protein
MKTAIKYIFLALLITTLSGCIEVKFRESQPKGVAVLMEIPDDFRGTYLNEDGDTLIINATDFVLLNRESECNKLTEKEALSDRLLIKVWKDYLFFNQNEDSLWTVALIQKITDDHFIFSLIDAENEETLKGISSITRMDTHLDEYGDPMIYVVDPVNNELEDLITQGIFDISYNFRRLQ